MDLSCKAGCTHLFTVVGWRAPGWAAAVSDRLAGALHTLSDRAWVVIHFEADNLRGVTVSEPPAGPVLVLAKPVTQDLLELQAWARSYTGSGHPVYLAIVDCRLGDVGAVVDVVLDWPRWPVAWLSPTGNHAHATARVVHRVVIETGARRMAPPESPRLWSSGMHERQKESGSGRLI